MKVEEIMNKALVIDENVSVNGAAKIMSDHSIGCLVIMKGEKVIGIVTEKDIIKNLGKLGQKISKIMSRSVISIDRNDSIDNAALIMSKNKVKKLPVIHKGRLEGIITATDIIAHSDQLNDNYLLD
ncbi:MAG: CBS domain-containing protein [archaeon]